jgi:hypothetical protein
MVEMLGHSQTKGRDNVNPNLGLNWRASPRPYLGAPGGESPLGDSTSCDQSYHSGSVSSRGESTHASDQIPDFFGIRRALSFSKD